MDERLMKSPLLRLSIYLTFNTIYSHTQNLLCAPCFDRMDVILLQKLIVSVKMAAFGVQLSFTLGTP